MSATVDVEAGYLIVRASDRAQLLSLLEARWSPQHRGYALPRSAAAAANLERRLPRDQAAWSPPALELLDRADRAIDARRYKADAPLAELPDLHGDPPAWEHQRRAYGFARDQDAFVLWVAMGGGKSRVAINVCDHLAADRVLITCKRTALDEDMVWQRELAKWSPREWLVGGLVYHRRKPGQLKARPGVTDRLAQLKLDMARAAAERRPFAAVAPWDSYWRGELGKWLLSQDWDVWLLDESQAIKAPNGKASKFAAQLRPRSDRRGLLSGTLLPHDRADVYAQYRAADPGIFGTSYTRFKGKYAREVPLGVGRATKIVGWQNLDEYDRKLHSIAYAWEQDREALGLLEPIWIERHTHLGPEARRVYDEIRAHMIAEVQAGAIVADNAMVRFLRLLQVASGVVTLANGEKARVGAELRDLLADVLDELDRDEPVVVFGQFHADLDAVHHVCRDQGRRSAELSGRVHGGLPVWKAGGADVLAVQNQAGGTSIDLTRARYGIWMNPGLALGDHLQTIARLDRPGQAYACTFVRLIVEGTESALLWRALDERRDGIQEVMRAWRR